MTRDYQPRRDAIEEKFGSPPLEKRRQHLKTIPASRKEIHCLDAFSMSLAAAFAAPLADSAVEVDTVSEDLKVRFDTAVRYSQGVHARDCENNICGDDADANDVMTNRIDLLSEFGAVWKDGNAPAGAQSNSNTSLA